MQTKHPTYAQAKGAPVGSYLDNVLLTKSALARAVYSVTAADPIQHSFNLGTALMRITALTKGLFVFFGENAQNTTAQAKTNLTLAVNPAENDEMTLGNQLYTFNAETVGYANGTLTLTGVITPGVHAENVVTSTGSNPTNNNVLTIGSTVYTFVNSVSAAYDVKIGTDAATTLANLKKAINASGTPGVEYGTGTLVHPNVVANTINTTTLKVSSRVPGIANNAVVTTSGDATLSWADTTLGGGTGASTPGVAAETVTIDGKTYSFVDILSETLGATAIANQVLFGADSAAALANLKLAVNGGATEGTNYSTGTVASTLVIAGTISATTLRVAAILSGVAGNVISTVDTLANGSWTSTTLTNGHADNGHTIIIGASLGVTQANVVKAVNATGTPGTEYSTALTVNTLVYAKAFATNVSEITSLLPGTEGDGIVTTGTFASGSNLFSAAATSGGADGTFDDYIPAGAMHEYAIDDSSYEVALLGDGGTATAVLVEHN